MSEIKYVCFDIGGVANVRTPNYIIASRASKYFKKLFNEEELRRMIHPEIDSRDIWREFQNGEINAEKYVNAALRMVKVPLTSENKRFFNSLLEEWCGLPYQSLLNLVEKLNQGGYHTSVLSNNNEIMYNTAGAEIKNHVNVAISSHEIGVSKPNLGAYSILLKKIKANKPEEVIFVDDQEQNIKAANNYGLQGFHFRSKELGIDGAFKELLGELKRKL